MEEDRIRFVTHRGKTVLLVDVSQCSPPEVQKIAKLVPAFVTQQPKESVLLLGDFTGATFDRAAITVLKESTVFDRPHVKRAAWIGTENLPEVFYEHIKTFSQREIPKFDS